MSKEIHRLDPSRASYQADIQKFHDELRNDGYVYVESTCDIDSTIGHLSNAARRFFDLPIEEKLKYEYSIGVAEKRKYRNAKLREQQSLYHRFLRGLQCVACVPKEYSFLTRRHVMSSSGEQSRGKWDPNPREYFDVTASVVRYCDNDFERTVKQGLQLFNQAAERYLEQLLQPLNVDMEYVRDIAQLNRDSLTTLRLLKYYYHGEAEKETCLRHTDRGLITLAYCQEGGLTVKDFHTHQWIDIEASAPSKPCLILFTGESLSRLTGGYFKAILHKVVSREDRFSFPFFYRGRTPALLDMTLMKSAMLNEMLSNGQLESLLPITVGDLDSITTKQYISNSIPLELGEFKKDPYYIFADEEVEVV